MTGLSEWLTPAEVKEKVGFSLNKIWLALECGELHGHQAKRRGHWRIKPEAVEAWIEGRDGLPACGCAQFKSRRRT